jgi:outer membrane protein assembly factor BamD (BamD/ComL family)
VADHLSRQVTAIREARVAIRGGDARAALAALDRELPEGGAGALAPEAALARVAAYCRLGDIESARRVANRFAAQYPQSPLVVRMRESCAGTPNQRGVTNF